MISEMTFTSTDSSIELNYEERFFLINGTHYYLLKRDTSFYMASLFILIGLIAFIFALFCRKDKKKPAAKDCSAQKSCYVTYGSTHFILPKLKNPSFFQKSIHYEGGKILSKLPKSTTETNLLINSKIMNISEPWKAKLRQSNNCSIIKTIPEEDEMKDENV